jgi:hypothetical protein
MRVDSISFGPTITRRASTSSLHDVKRLVEAADPEAPALADRVVDHAGMGAQNAPVGMDDLARLGRAGAQLLDHAA